MNEDQGFPEEHQADTRGVYYFRETRLEPLSFERQLAAQQLMAGRAGKAVDVLFIYVCMRSEDDIEEALCNRDVAKKFREDAFKWAESVGANVHTDNAAMKEISALADRMWEDLGAVAFDPDVKGGSPPPNATG